MRLTYLIFMLLLAPLANASEIYKWIDENGKAHFGDVIPERYKKSSSRIDAKPVNTMESRHPKSGIERSQAGQENSPPTPVATSKGKESTRFKSDAEKCREQMQKFQESEACFSRFRNTNGSVKDGAFQECEDIKRPPPCPN